jgi:hypothetical protein
VNGGNRVNANVQAFAGIGWTLVVGEHVKDASDDGGGQSMPGKRFRFKAENRTTLYSLRNRNIPALTRNANLGRQNNRLPTSTEYL